MNKFALGLFCISTLFFASNNYYGSTTAPVTIAGGIIKAKHVDENTHKYKRKDCPVCKGKGWYMSGDDIKRIECTYCEPDSGVVLRITPAPRPPTKDGCVNGRCPIR